MRIIITFIKRLVRWFNAATAEAATLNTHDTYSPPHHAELVAVRERKVQRLVAER